MIRERFARMKAFLIALGGIGFFLMFSLALAQETAPASPAPSPVDYALPYPGILPDNPLFFLKRLRDLILIQLISNPVRKAEFHQLLADKYHSMGEVLLEKGKAEIAISTFTKGTQFDADTRKYLSQIPAENMAQLNQLTDRFSQSLTKHIEVLTRSQEKFSGENLTTLQTSITSLTELQKGL